MSLAWLVVATMGYEDLECRIAGLAFSGNCNTFVVSKEVILLPAVPFVASPFTCYITPSTCSAPLPT